MREYVAQRLESNDRMNRQFGMDAFVGDADDAWWPLVMRHQQKNGVTKPEKEEDNATT